MFWKGEYFDPSHTEWYFLGITMDANESNVLIVENKYFVSPILFNSSLLFLFALQQKKYLWVFDI